MTAQSPVRRGPGRPRKPIARAHLLQQAAACFAEHGYDAASVSLLAASAGLSKASLFHHVASKELLYLEVLSAIVGDLGKLVLDARMDEGGFLDRLDRLGALVVRYLGSSAVAGRLMIRELVAGGPFMLGPGAAAVQAILRVTAEFLEAGMDEGVFAPQDPRQLAMSIVGVHLYWFASPAVTSSYIAADPFSDEHIEARERAVLRHVRALCGVQPG